LGERDVVRLVGRFPPESAEAVRRLGEVELVQEEAEQILLALRDAARRLPELLRALSEAGAEIRETIVSQPTLESLFIRLTGKELRE
jgi:ABC-2 type transport system ATP-binding protein